MIIERCFARVGLIGNPSDGFGGKTVSLLLGNFYAEVTILDATTIQIEQNPTMDAPSAFKSLDDLHIHVSKNGYYGVYRLMLATCKMFAQVCSDAGVIKHLAKGFKLSYDTNIPRMVGLSGSSALIVAAFNGLLKHYELTLDNLHITKAKFPQAILNIEKEELGISAGLQDRVIQVYGGVVHMDFDPAVMASTGTGVYTPLDPAQLPNLYLAYNYKFGSDSGAVHSTVKDRWAKQDPELVVGMKRLGQLADEAREAIAKGDSDTLADLMDENFAIRRRLYGVAVVGTSNLAAIELMRRHGFGAKFSGSGGACICVRRNSSDW